MLELDGIQGLLLTQGLVFCGRYSFLAFRDRGSGRRFLSQVVHEVGSAETAGALPSSYVYLGLTYNGLRTLGIAESSLATFPRAFRAGMPARARELGDCGASHPAQWVGGLASPNLHALLLLFAVDPDGRSRRVEEHQSILGSSPGVCVLSELDVDLPATFREHFGYVDGISKVCVEGTGVEPSPGSGPSARAGEFVLGHPDETGSVPTLPRPEWLTYNASFLAYRRLRGCRCLSAIPSATRFFA